VPAGPQYRQYVSDPANPVPYRVRPISPTYPEPEWRTWEVADQRFVDHRPDVLSFESAPNAGTRVTMSWRLSPIAFGKET